MRVRILKRFVADGALYQVGEVREIDPAKAGAWLESGLVMQDKSQDGAKETKGDDR